MMHPLDVRRFHGPMMAAGLVPPNCKLWELSVGVSGALSVRYEVFLTAEQLVQLGTIFHDIGTAQLDADRARRHVEADAADAVTHTGGGSDV